MLKGPVLQSVMVPRLPEVLHWLKLMNFAANLTPKAISCRTWLWSESSWLRRPSKCALLHQNSLITLVSITAALHAVTAAELDTGRIALHGTPA